MGILSGAMTARRFTVLGEIPQGFRDTWRDALREHAFSEPPVASWRDEIEGWVEIHDILATGFDDINHWFVDPYVLLALRVDKKTLPAKLFKATLAREIREWCESRSVDRCPLATRNDLKEELERKWLARALPRVSVVEACWNVDQGWLLLHSHAERAADRFRRLFTRTFDLQLVPWSPLEWVEDPAVADGLITGAPHRLHGED